MPSAAADLDEEIKELEEQQAELKRQREQQASDIDVATVETEELTQALEVWNLKVNEKESDLGTAQAKLDAAEVRYKKASAEVAIAEAKMADLKDKVADRAVNAFVGRDLGAVKSLNNREPKESTRMKTMVGEATDQDFDIAEELRATRSDLAVKQAQTDAAKQQADEQRAIIEADLIEVEKARDRQAELANEAEVRLEAELYELAILEERDAEVAEQHKAKTQERARRIAAARVRNNPAPSTQGSTKYPTADQITSIGGFWVHVEIADNFEKMLAAAKADGITFGGWAYRDHAAQIRLRKAHCGGSSNYAVYQKPSSQCSPPTARPGRSQHELGKAIDFTYGGRTIGSRSNTGYKWLAKNAANYGFYNLPSEPWHWSVNGR